jgi:hypothetical protein
MLPEKTNNLPPQLTKHTSSNDINNRLFNTIKSFDSIGQAKNSVGEEQVIIVLIAGFSDLIDFYKVSFKPEGKQLADICLLVLKHETYSTYSIDTLVKFFERAKMGELGKSFNRFDGPVIFEMLNTFNGFIEQERELKLKDDKHTKIHNTKMLVGELFSKFKEMGKDISFGKKNKVDKEKTREASRHYNNFMTLWEAQGKPGDNKIDYNNKRITSSEYLTLKTQP